MKMETVLRGSDLLSLLTPHARQILTHHLPDPARFVTALRELSARSFLIAWLRRLKVGQHVRG